MYTMFQLYTDSARVDQYHKERVEEARVKRELLKARADDKSEGFAARFFALFTTAEAVPQATTLGHTAI